MPKFNLIVTVAFLIPMFISAMAAAQDWMPAKGPLATRWTEKVSPTNALPEYPRPQLVRKEWQNLNGLWDFGIEGQQDKWHILVPYAPETALSGVMKHGDRGWYERKFAVPDEWKDKRVLLHFGAVDYECTISVNGKKVGSHRGGYDAFNFDITDSLSKGGEQTLRVEVIDNTSETQPRGKQIKDPHGIFYTPTTGIWQTVWLEPVNGRHIASIKLTPDVDKSMLVVEPQASRKGHWFLATASVKGQPVAVTKGDEGSPLKLQIKDAHLWSPEDPFLYDLKIEMYHGSEKFDEVSSYFGMRKIEVKSDGKFNRLMLNDKPLFQIGLLDQGFWPDGLYTAPTDEALKYDIEITKKLGFNMIRKHVKVEPARWYYWADTLGVVVWQDMPSTFAKEKGDWQKQFEAELRAMIEQLRNSPAIVMWVPINEGWGQPPYGDEGTRHLAKLVKELDPTRLVNNASGWTDAGAGDVNDMHRYPGPGMPKVEEKRAAVLGEFGGLGLFVQGKTWSEKSFSYKGLESPAELVTHYRRLLGRAWELHDQGLSAIVYTQTTDVETECNGLMTYDRTLKCDAEPIAQANRGEVPRVDLKVVVATSHHEPQTWRYTFDQPAEDWMKPEFSDSSWKSGPGGFGTEGTPGAVVRTVWNTPDIYIRRTFELPKDVDLKSLDLLLHHDEACEVYINGVLAGRRRGNAMEYEEQRISDDARKTLKAGGVNTLAVHCHNTTGGQYIDVGLMQLVEKRSGK